MSVVGGAVRRRPAALLARLTFKGSWDGDNNPTTPCWEKTFRTVAERFDSALVILADVRKNTDGPQPGPRPSQTIWTLGFFCYLPQNFTLLFSQFWLLYVNSDYLLFFFCICFFFPHLPFWQWKRTLHELRHGHVKRWVFGRGDARWSFTRGLVFS